MCPSAPSAWGVQKRCEADGKNLTAGKVIALKAWKPHAINSFVKMFCPDALILQREIPKMIYSSGRIHSRKFWAPQPYILTFAWWSEPEIWLVVSNAPPRREPSRWDLHLWDQRLQMAWSKDVKNLNRRQKAYWTENARQLAWKPLENKI